MTIRFAAISWTCALIWGTGCVAKDVAEPAESEPEINADTAAERTNYTVDSDAGRIAAISVGMPEAEIRNLGLPYETRYEILEGDEYRVYDLLLPDEVRLTCTLNLDMTVHRIESESPEIRDKYGLGAKSPLCELRRAYPAGRLIWGTAEGRFANFLTGSRLIFRFSKDDLDESCFGDQQDCVIDDGVVVQSIFITRYAAR